MSTIKTWEKRLERHTGHTGPSHIKGHEEAETMMKLQEIKELRAALSKAEQERDESQIEAAQILKHVGEVIVERDAAIAKLKEQEEFRAIAVQHANVTANEAICYQKTISELQAKLAALAAQEPVGIFIEYEPGCFEQMAEFYSGIKLYAAAGAATVSTDFAAWLIDHCEGQIVSEESVQHWLFQMLEAAP